MEQHGKWPQRCVIRKNSQERGVCVRVCMHTCACATQEYTGFAQASLKPPQEHYYGLEVFQTIPPKALYHKSGPQG